MRGYSKKAVCLKVVTFVSLVALPILGVAAFGRSVRGYLEFPPLTRYTEHAGFSWIAFAVMALGIGIVLAPFALRVLISNVRGAKVSGGAVDVSPAARRTAFRLFLLGMLLVGAGWFFAWNRFEWFSPFQIYTFTPIWFGYILVVNGLTMWRSGRCLLLSAPLFYAELFAVSAAFWWFFEYLNRFVQNWYYVGIGDLSPFEYFVYATLSFSTVLPAVFGTKELLDTFPRLFAGLDAFLRFRPRNPRRLASTVLAVSAAALFLVGIFPDWLYPFLWLAPLGVMVSVLTFLGRESALSNVSEGDWRGVAGFALSALVCGFFWEMWNYHSVAKWIYAVPFVGGVKVFEMPLLGYAGYLPFGLECAVVVELLGVRREGGARRRGIVSVETMVYGNAALIVGLAAYFLLIPGCLVLRNITDPALRNGVIPEEAWRLHRYLTPRYERYVRERIASKAAGRVDYRDVPSTEWPLFGSVFYLWATEHLQKAWEAGEGPPGGPEPAVYARKTIEACKDLLLDPVHHTWVRTHWGDDYMHHENVFFRSLLIAGLTSYENLIGEGEYLPLLKDQCDTLSEELDASPYGVLYDYPGECYPIDVFAAVAWIKEADKTTGDDHSAFFARESRAFQGENLDKRGLISWMMNPRTGKQLGGSRGIVNSHVLSFAPDIYPELAEKWYRLYEKYFWQKSWLGEGWREFYRERPDGDWTFDVDSGPVIGGFSPAANAFGFAAAERNGRLDHAYTLGVQILTAAWPLPDGRLLGCRLLSNPHAPYLGEAGMLWQLTATPPKGVNIVRGGHWTGAVWIGMAFYFGVFALVLAGVGLDLRSFRRRREKMLYHHVTAQFAVWLGLLAAACVAVFFNGIAALFLALCARFLPRGRALEEENDDESSSTTVSGGLEVDVEGGAA